MVAGTKEGEVSDHDHVGNAGNPRDDGRIETPRNAQAIEAQDDNGSRDHRQGREIGRSKGEIKARTINNAGEDFEAVYRELHVTSGPLPGADDYNLYPAEVQAHILECHKAEIKAMFTDESERQNKLVDAEIKRDKMMVLLSFVVEAILAVGPLVGFAVTGYKEMLWAYTILGASLIGNVVININGNKRRVDDRKEDE